jgi:hypothetical protein
MGTRRGLESGELMKSTSSACQYLFKHEKSAIGFNLNVLDERLGNRSLGGALERKRRLQSIQRPHYLL